MCTVPTVPNVLMGPSLTSFIASNYALLQPTLVPIQGGSFMMGAGTDYGAHPATVSSFQMGRTPVTNDEYARYFERLGPNRFALLGTDPSTKTLGVIAIGPNGDNLRPSVISTVREVLVASGLGAIVNVMRNIVPELVDELKVVRIGDSTLPKGLDSSRQPVVNISWYEAFVYAFLHGGMLPTEWQWEYAARVVQGREGLREYATPSGQLTHEEAHFDAQSTVDVDDPRYPTLENGLRHMTGNVWEWMQNWHGDYPQGEVVDPAGSLEGSYRGLRGGSWYNNNPESPRAANRYYNQPGVRYDRIGFRVVAPAQP